LPTIEPQHPNILPKPGWLLKRKEGESESDELKPIMIMKCIENYKLTVEVEYAPGTYRNTIAVLDFGASFNIIHVQALPKGWEQSPDVDHNGDTRNLQDAKGTVSQKNSTIYMSIKIGLEAKRLRFLVMKELAVPLILGCEFLNELVRSIFPKDQRIELSNGETIPLYNHPVQRHPTPVYMAQGVTLSPYSETNVLMRTDNNGTCLIQNGPRLKHYKNLPYAVAPGIQTY
jgi:Retroviral aspartyl protease